MAILVLGIVLIIFGMKASDSVESDFSKVFSGTVTTKALWLLAGGIISVIVGGMISLRPERRQRDSRQMKHKT